MPTGHSSVTVLILVSFVTGIARPASECHASKPWRAVDCSSERQDVHARPLSASAPIDNASKHGAMGMVMGSPVHAEGELTVSGWGGVRTDPCGNSHHSGDATAPCGALSSCSMTVASLVEQVCSRQPDRAARVEVSLPTLALAAAIPPEPPPPRR